MSCMEPMVSTARVAAAVLLLATAGGCDDDGYTGPCSKEERAVAREVAHPKGLKLKFVRDYDESCVADLRVDQAGAALEYYRQQLPRQGWELRIRDKAGAVFAKDGMRFAVRLEPGPEPMSYILITKDEAS